MKKTNSIKKRIIATAFSVITVLSIGAFAAGSASAAELRYPHEHYRGKGFNNVRIIADRADNENYFNWP